MSDLPEPITREDEYLKYIADNCVPTNGKTRSITLPVSIENGGTGGTTIEEARTNLELYNKTETDTKLNETVPISKGGTGGTTETDARTNLEIYNKSETDSKLNVTKAINKGGTGGTSVSTARTNLDVYSKSEVDNLLNITPTPSELTEVATPNIQPTEETAGGSIIGGPCSKGLSGNPLADAKLIMVIARPANNQITEPDYPIKTLIIPNTGRYAVNGEGATFNHIIYLGDRSIEFTLSANNITCCAFSQDIELKIVYLYKLK